MLEMNARSLQQKLETERELKQRLMEEVLVICDHKNNIISYYIYVALCYELVPYKSLKKTWGGRMLKIFKLEFEFLLFCLCFETWLIFKLHF